MTLYPSPTLADACAHKCALGARRSAHGASLTWQCAFNVVWKWPSVCPVGSSAHQARLRWPWRLPKLPGEARQPPERPAWQPPREASVALCTASVRIRMSPYESVCHQYASVRLHAASGRAEEAGGGPGRAGRTEAQKCVFAKLAGRPPWPPPAWGSALGVPGEAPGARKNTGNGPLPKHPVAPRDA